MPNPIVNKASAVWNGDLFTGSGKTTLETSGLASLNVNWKARAEESGGGATTPEELIATAHAACYCMAFSNGLAKNGTPPTQLDASAEVTFLAGTGITGIHLTVRGDVPGLDDATFKQLAEGAKTGCPVSQALKAVPITLDAALA